MFVHLICIWPNRYGLSAIESFLLTVVGFFIKCTLLKNGYNSSQLLSPPDFPENCKWTKSEEIWRAALTSKWLGTVLGLCSAGPCPDHILPIWLQLLWRFALLCSTVSFAGPQRNGAFAFYICFVQMSVKLFSMWACSYQEAYAHFINRQKHSLPSSRSPGCPYYCIKY